MGLSREDFVATRYFRQGEMARLVTLDPGPRLDLVAGWLRLQSVQDCEDDAADALRELARRRDEASAEAVGREVAEAEAYASVGIVGKDPDTQLQALTAAAQAAVFPAQTMIDAATEALERDRGRAGAQAAAEAYERVVADGKRVAAELQVMVGSEEKPDGRALSELKRSLMLGLEDADSALREAGAKKGVAAAEAGAKRRLLSGGFDGRCPVVGAPCPARAFVDAEATKMGQAAEVASQALLAATAAYDGAARGQSEAAVRLQALETKARRLGELRQEASRLKPSYELWRSLSEASDAAGAEAMLAQGKAELKAVEARQVALEHARASAAAAVAKGQAARAAAEHLERAVATAAAAVAIFGRGGAQRRLAEGALEEIQDGACSMMADAGIPLQVAVQWSREGSGAASTCVACGDAFPRSEKVKACARCGAARGLQQINRLEIEPSAQSGGGRDLAGIFVQLAAAAWLVEDRGAQWGTAMLDEPLAALDAHMRRALASHLPAILRETGVEQAFIIGHDRAALDALPARILIESKDGRSTARVA